MERYFAGNLAAVSGTGMRPRLGGSSLKRLGKRRAKKLPANLAGKNLRDERRNGISDHALHLGSSTLDLKPIWKCLQSRHFLKRQPAIAPMERAYGCAWLRLDCPGWQPLRKLKEEAPVARAPPEQRMAATAARMPQVVLALRDARQRCPTDLRL